MKQWPGSQMNADTREGWVTITLEASDFTELKVIFSCGSVQTGNIVVDLAKPYFYGFANEGYATYEEAEAACKANPEVVNNITLEFTPSEAWKKDNSRFAAYVFGKGGNKWFDLTLNEAGNYEFSFDNNLYDSVIFCAMKGDAKENNWENRLYQTSDLKLFTVEKHIYVLPQEPLEKAPETADSWK